MKLIPLKILVRDYKLIYKNELEGKLSAGQLLRIPSPELRANRIASKIYTYYLLSTLLKLDKAANAAVIGRSFYLPSSEISGEAEGLSRINTGIIRIPDLGAFVIDLGGANGAEITTTDNRSIKFVYSGDEIKIHPMALITAITIFAAGAGYKIDSDYFPSEFNAIPFNPNPEYQQILKIFFEKVKANNEKYLSSMKDKADQALKTTLMNIAECSCEYTASSTEQFRAPELRGRHITGRELYDADTNI